MGRRIKLFLVLGLLVAGLGVVVFALRSPFEKGPVSDIKLFSSRQLIVYCQDVSAESARYLPFYRPPGLQQVKSFFYENVEHAQRPKLWLTFWHTWFGHTFPEFQVSCDGRPVMVFAGIPAKGYHHQNPANMQLPYNPRGSEHFSYFSRQVLFCFDGDEMTCTVLEDCKKDNQAWWVPFHLNFERQYFPVVYMTDIKKAMRGVGPIWTWKFAPPPEADRKHMSYQGRLVSLSGESTIDLRDELRGYSSFLLSDGSIVSQWGPTNVRYKTQSDGVTLTEMEYAGNWLCQNGKVVDDLLETLLAITPDTKHVFYSKWNSKEYITGDYIWQSPDPAWRADNRTSLWVYEPESGLTRQVRPSVGLSLAVSADSQKFGVLDGALDIPPAGHFWDPALQGPRGNRNVAYIQSATIFDLEGNVLERFTFDPAIVTRAWDWDIDAKIIAYYDAARRLIVVRSLSGEVISEFEP